MGLANQPALTELAGRHRITVCVEDAIADVGIGAHLSHHIGRTHPRTRTYTLGLPPAYIPTPAATTSFPATDSPAPQSA
ncbi:1-deoxy-D-xylulose 5-phosphate synthase [Mycobacterium tuberculosis variant microti]|nr:1-deoxy-D-xylulose 5-phosphate synthase [Mycobacterium tuberculosis variant microti]